MKKDKSATVLQGTIKRHPDGFGFLIPEQIEHEDVYIPRHSMNGAMTNDKVKIKVDSQNKQQKNSNRYSGEIIEIIEHSTKQILGRYHKANDRFGFIVDEGKGWGENLKIPVSAEKGAKDGQWVSAIIKSYPESGEGFVGEIKEILGSIEDPLNDTKRAIMNHGIPTEFSEKTKKEIAHLRPDITSEDIKGRKDLNHVNFVTIDGATARDFDDAVCCEKTESGFKVWVGIADVSHYVKPGSALDDDAYERGNSTYFPNFVVPMLPEILSNELCSLRPKIPRLSVVAEMRLGYDGSLQSYEFHEAVITSRARLTYGIAQEIVEDAATDFPTEVIENVKLCADIAKILMAKRFREGSLDLDLGETQLVLDEGGNPTDIIKSERLFAHRLIEELMLLANVCVATYFHTKNIPAIYRIHEAPAADNIKKLERLIFSMTSRAFYLSGEGLQKKLSKALEVFHGKPESPILSMLTLRTMNQAQYSAQNIGHFGLGFSHYSHFTSPIRRYPDLIVHRLLKSLFLKTSKYQAIEESELSSAATHLTACEQRSVKSERQFQAIKKARFMMPQIGKKFEGYINSVAKFGIFVQLRAFDVDGLVKIEELGDDKFVFNEENLTLVGKRTGVVYKMGDPITIEVKDANPELGLIDFGIAVGTLATANPRTSKRDSLLAEFLEREKQERLGQKKSFKESRNDEDRRGGKERRHKKKDENNKHRKTNRKDAKKRGPSEDDSRHVRKARVSGRRRKG